MTVSNIEDVDALACRLRDLLEEEALLLGQRRSRLADLAEALADNDEPRLERLLAEMEAEVASQAQREGRPAQVMRRLAEALDCPEESERLSRLIGRLPPWHQGGIAQARARIVQQARDLRRQYRQTAMLLSECARINRALLDSLLRAGPTVSTYDAEGPRQWRPGGGVVDAER